MNGNENLKIALIDGHEVLFRYFWGMPFKLADKKGVEIQGAYGFIAYIIRILKEFHPDFVLVCFDSQGVPSRASIDPHYKANRQVSFAHESKENNPFSQLEFIKNALNYLQISEIEMPGVEADDIIGSYSNHFSCSTNKVLIFSNDSDYLQLVSECTNVVSKRGGKQTIYNVDVVQQTYGILPAQMILYKALVGDQSDNIKGVNGVGKKTASKLINTYSSLKNIISSIDEIKTSLKANLIAQQGIIERNISIIKINTDIVIDSSIIKPNIFKNKVSPSVRDVFKKINLL